MSLDTLNDLFLDRESNHPHPDLLGHNDGSGWKSISSDEFGEQVRNTSQGLLSLGVERGDRVALLSETRFEWTVTDHAILALGSINVPIYQTLLPDQIAFILGDAVPTVVVCSTAEQLEKIEAIRDRIPPVKHIVCFEPVARAEILTLEKVQELGKVHRRRNPQEFDELSGSVDKEDVATIIYTSGTTGDPKGVMLTHDNLVQNVLNVLDVVRTGPADVALSFLPLSHVFERTAHYFLLFSGARICYAQSIEKVPQNLRETTPTVMVSVPRLYEKIYAKVRNSASQGGTLKQKIFNWATKIGRANGIYRLDGRRSPLGLAAKAGIADRLVFSKVRAATGGRLRLLVSGGAPLGAEIAEFFYSARIPILEGYGLTETSPVITCNGLEAIRFGSVGRTISGMEVRIAADGEILTRGHSVMKGYYKNPEATAQAIVDGWFHTGDIGRVDDDGFLFITDRKKDIIVTASGKNLAPQPTEAKLKQHSLVAEAALIGDKRKYVIALIVPSFEALDSWARERQLESDDLSGLLSDARVRNEYQHLVDEVNAQLPRYEQIKKFALLATEFSIESGELTPTLKVKRRVIQKKYAELIESLYAAGVED